MNHHIHEGFRLWKAIISVLSETWVLFYHILSLWSFTKNHTLQTKHCLSRTTDLCYEFPNWCYFWVVNLAIRTRFKFAHQNCNSYKLGHHVPQLALMALFVIVTRPGCSTSTTCPRQEIWFKTHICCNFAVKSSSLGIFLDWGLNPIAPRFLSFTSQVHFKQSIVMFHNSHWWRCL